MGYVSYPLTKSIEINKFITFLYYELQKDFVSHGEKHDFWELLYLDKGEIEIRTDTDTHILKQGELIIYRPNEFHIGRTSRGLAPNIFIVSFECVSTAMSFFHSHQKFSVNDQERLLLLNIIQEGKNAFGNNLLHGLNTDIFPLDNISFGCEQLCKNYLEALLIQLIRNDSQKKHPLTPTTTENRDVRLFHKIAAYIEKNLGENLTIEQIGSHFNLSRSRLGILFKKQTGSSMKQYVNSMRIDKAKTLIRDELYNMSEIAELLGYNGVHYFSRQFKKATGMSPSEYANSVQARIIPVP